MASGEEHDAFCIVSLEYDGEGAMVRPSVAERSERWLCLVPLRSMNTLWYAGSKRAESLFLNIHRGYLSIIG